jgi:hypothetical protein
VDLPVKVLGSDGGVTYTWRSASLRRTAGTHRFALPDYEQSYEHELDAFVRAIRGEAEAITSTIYDARDVAGLLERARPATGADRGTYISGVFDASAQQPK